MMNLEAIRNTINENRAAGREQYDGLSSAEIGRYNRALMFGDNDEAFPSDSEWSAIVD
jgi:hypothetical protein